MFAPNRLSRVRLFSVQRNNNNYRCDSYYCKRAGNAPPDRGRRAAAVAAHVLAAAVRILVEFLLDELPRAQTDVAARIVVHALVQIEHDFVLLVALVAPVNVHFFF